MYSQTRNWNRGRSRGSDAGGFGWPEVAPARAFQKNGQVQAAAQRGTVLGSVLIKFKIEATAGDDGLGPFLVAVSIPLFVMTHFRFLP